MVWVYNVLMTWIGHIFIAFMALLSPILPHKAVVATTTPPTIIEAPKDVVTGGRITVKSVVQTESDSGWSAPAATTSLPLVNPNASFMEVHGVEGTAVAPAPTVYMPTDNEDIYGNYSTGGYSK